MHRINTPSATVDNKFQDGNALLGTAPTQFNASWCNAIQESIAKLVEAAGLTLSEGDDTQLLNAVLGLSAAGGAGAQWQPYQGDAPTQTEENGGLVYLFESGQTSRLNLLVKVPETHVVGKQIVARVPHYSPSSSGTQLLSATSYLIRKNTDAVTSVANSRASTNTALTNTVANMYRYTVLDLTGTDGKINSILVQPGDLIRVVLARGTDTDTGDIRVISKTTEVIF